MPKTGADDLHLPPEICKEILIRLPVKSILRFRSVCKSWYSVISCPNFINIYSIRNLNKNGHRALLHLYPSNDNWKNGVCSFRSHDKSFMESREHDEIPESFRGFSTSVVGSCNGLICLHESQLTSDNVRVVNLWNPTIRKIVELPSPTFGRYDSWCGFGFDSKTSDYKVRYEDMIFQILDLRKGVWRDISPNDPSLSHKVRHHPDCYLDGAVHWSRPGILFSFNFSDECFRKIKLPDCAEFGYNEDGSCINFKSVTFGGLIHVIVFSKLENGPAIMSNSCSIWTMKEYGVAESWTKVYDINLRRAQVSRSTCLSPNQFLLWENGEILMVHGFRCGEDLVMYNTRSRKSKCVLSFAEPGRVFSYPARIQSVWLYEESLVLM